jgi:hypothetical protein
VLLVPVVHAADGAPPKAGGLWAPSCGFSIVLAAVLLVGFALVVTFIIKSLLKNVTTMTLAGRAMSEPLRKAWGPTAVPGLIEQMSISVNVRDRNSFEGTPEAAQKMRHIIDDIVMPRLRALGMACPLCGQKRSQFIVEVESLDNPEIVGITCGACAGDEDVAQSGSPSELPPDGQGRTVAQAEQTQASQPPQPTEGGTRDDEPQRREERRDSGSSGWA